MALSEDSPIFSRGVAEAIGIGEMLRHKDPSAPLRVKLGIDPSAPDLHIGHAVPLRKLRQFQEAGHTAVLVIGDYTARIGDPTGKDETRRSLSERDVKENAKTYLMQARKVLFEERLEVHRQSKWFGRFSLADTIELMSRVTVPQLLAHDTFRQRLDSEGSFALHELLYPLLQAYDSVVVKPDIELGATEQKFNIFMGRMLMKAFGLPQQAVLLNPYLIGTDGKEKMSKSLGNIVAILDSPNDMYGKVMSLDDAQIKSWFELTTGLSDDAIADILKRDNPRDQKDLLAKEIVRLYHSVDAAKAAAAHFHRTFREKSVDPESLPTVALTGAYNAVDLLLAAGLVKSKGEGRRAIEQGGFKVDGRTVADWQDEITLVSGMVLQKGKRNFVRIT